MFFWKCVILLVPSVASCLPRGLAVLCSSPLAPGSLFNSPHSAKVRFTWCWLSFLMLWSLRKSQGIRKPVPYDMPCPSLPSLTLLGAELLGTL